MLMDALNAATALVAIGFLGVLMLTALLIICIHLAEVWGQVLLPLAARHCRWIWIQRLCQRVNGFHYRWEGAMRSKAYS